MLAPKHHYVFVTQSELQHYKKCETELKQLKEQYSELQSRISEFEKKSEKYDILTELCSIKENLNFSNILTDLNHVQYFNGSENSKVDTARNWQNFISDLCEFFQINKVKEEHKVYFFKRRLKSEALDYYNFIKETCQNFSDYVAKFKQHYFGVDDVHEALEEMNSTNIREDENLLQYGMRLYNYLYMWNECDKENTTTSLLYHEIQRAFMKPLHPSIKRTKAVAIAIDEKDIRKVIEESSKDLNNDPDLLQRPKKPETIETEIIDLPVPKDELIRSQNQDPRYHEIIRSLNEGYVGKYKNYLFVDDILCLKCQNKFKVCIPNNLKFQTLRFLRSENKVKTKWFCNLIQRAEKYTWKGMKTDLNKFFKRKLK